MEARRLDSSSNVQGVIPVLRQCHEESFCVCCDTDLSNVANWTPFCYKG